MIRLLVSGIAHTFAEPPVRDTDAPASTGPIPLSDAQMDQVSGGAFGQLLYAHAVVPTLNTFIPPNPVFTGSLQPSEPIQPGLNISSVAKAHQITF
jgi:hypothetical protein